MTGHHVERLVAFTGGPIRTMVASTAHPSVLIVRNDRVHAVGGSELLERHSTAEVVDLGGRVLAPGFIDAHNHLSIAALHPRWRDLSEVASREELVVELRAQAAAEPEAEWVRGHGWDETHHGFAPDREDLDAAGVDRPVIVAHSTLHKCVVSSAGLDRLGIGRATPDPPGGEIGRDAKGTPTGVLLERAWSAAHAESLAAYADPDRWAEHIVARARSLIAEGVTCVHDAACAPAAESVYRTMAARGTLPIGVVAMPHSAALLENDAGSRLEGPRRATATSGSGWAR
jgi:hypothetical protein